MNSTCTEILRAIPKCPAGALRESLASVFMRTAEVNDTSPALLLNAKFSALGRFRVNPAVRALGGGFGQTLNGSRNATSAAVARIEELTKLTNLRSSTTLAFAPFATPNGLLRRHLAWDPEELGSNGYYPLLWALEPVKVSTSSSKPLVSLCPRCRERLPTLTGSSRINECYRCRHPLDAVTFENSSADPLVRTIKSIDYELWIARQLGEFIEFQVEKSLPADFNYTATLKFWFENFGLKNSKTCARSLGVSQPSISIWFSTDAIPQLRATLNLCWVFGLSLLQFLHRQIPAQHDGRLVDPIDANTRKAAYFRRRKIDKPALEHRLVEILRENKYAMLSFEEICEKRLHRSGFVVRQCFPDLARAIGKRYLENRKLMASIRQEQFCASIKAVARFLHFRGVVPNHKTLAPYLDQPSRLRCVWAIRALNDVKAELGYQDDGEQMILAV